MKDLFIFGNTINSELRVFSEAKYKAFSDGETSWIEFNLNGQPKIEKFKGVLQAFEEILKLQENESLYLAVSLAYEFGSVFEKIEVQENSPYPFPIYSIFGYVSEVKPEVKKEIITSLNSKDASELEKNLQCNIVDLERYSNWSRLEYISAILKIKSLIKDGETYQVNFSQNFKLPCKIEPFLFFKYLAIYHPAPYSCLMNLSSNYADFSSVVVSNSPELFLEKCGNIIKSSPIKGTRMRGLSVAEDEVLKNELINSEKDLSELSMIVDLQRNDLSRISIPGSVEVIRHAEHKKFSNVHHLVSEIKGDLQAGVSIIDILKSTFPCGSISGAPKIAAQKFISSLEKSSRNIFTGSLGIIEPNKDFILNVAIRTGVIRNQELFFSAGGGIVYDSNPESEYEETLTKAKAFYKNNLFCEEIVKDK